MIQSKIHLADLNKEGGPVKTGPMSWKQKMRYWPCRVGRFVISGLRKRMFTEANGSHVSQQWETWKGRSWSKPCSAGNGSGFNLHTYVQVSVVCVSYICPLRGHGSSDTVLETGISDVLTYVSKYRSSLKGIKALWIKGHSSAGAGKVQNWAWNIIFYHTIKNDRDITNGHRN